MRLKASVASLFLLFLAAGSMVPGLAVVPEPAALQPVVPELAALQPATPPSVAAGRIVRQQEGAPSESWSGAIAGIEFIVTFSPAEDGSGFAATLDIPTQGLVGYPVSDVVYTDTEIAFTLPIAPPDGATWRATREAGATSATGELEQGATTVAFTMEMLAEGESTEPARPQTPKPPFPYDSREVSYTNDADGTRLAGTLTVPRGTGPFPAALLITGSGPQNRDEEIFGHKPFWVIADHLTRNGVAVLRVDDRGVGDSVGELATATTEDFAGDALAGVRFLASLDEIDAQSIGLIGHSEGGIIAPMVAGRSDDVAFLVLLAGTGIPGVDLMVMQLEATQRSIGRPEENIARQAVVQRRLLEQAAAGAGLPEITETVAELTRIQVSTVAEDERPSTEQLEPGIEGQARQLTSPWFRYFLNFDPRSALGRVRAPTLALNGSLDTQVPAGVNLEEIRQALEAAGNPDVTVRELEGLNHLFQSAQTGSPTEYASIEETFSPVALEIITDWVLARFGTG